MISFNKQYFILAVLLFIIEVLIALFVHDAIIRPYIGDLLVVILIYCFLKSFLNISVLTAAVSVLIFSVTVELLQYLKIVEVLGLQNNKVAKIIIGTSFAWLDLLVYALGIAIVLLVEKIINPLLNFKQLKWYK
jgi:hypothetical protein